MGRYIGPKVKIARRLGEKIFGTAAEDKYFPRRGYPPGVHGPANQNPRLSDYGGQLREKQKAKRIYGLLERQFARYVREATAQTGNTLEALERRLETRLDNAVYRLGFARTRAQARQLVCHGHVKVNGKKSSIPSYAVRKGDVIAVREKSRNLPFLSERVASPKEVSAPPWLSCDPASASGTVLHAPAHEEMQLQFDTKRIIEFYSR